MSGLITPLFHLRFWIEFVPAPFTPAIGRVIFSFMVLLLLIWLVIQLIEYLARHNKIFRDRLKLEKSLRQDLGRFSELCFWSGASGLAWYWLTIERIPLFGMRLIFLFWLVGFGLWFAFIIRDRFRQQKGLASEAERSAYEKWLPKPKKS